MSIFGIPESVIAGNASAAITAAKKQGLLEPKKSAWATGLEGIGSFLGSTFVAYETAKAQPSAIAPAPASTPASSGVSPMVVIGGAAALGLLLVFLRRR